MSEFVASEPPITSPVVDLTAIPPSLAWLDNVQITVRVRRGVDDNGIVRGFMLTVDGKGPITGADTIGTKAAIPLDQVALVTTRASALSFVSDAVLAILAHMGAASVSGVLALPEEPAEAAPVPPKIIL